MHIKELLPIATFLLSIVTAYAAIDARNAAHSLKQKQFDTTTALQLLDKAYSEIKDRENDQTNDKLHASATFLDFLGRVERIAKQDPPHIVQTFIETIDERGYLSANDKVFLEAVTLSNAPDPQPSNIPVLPNTGVGPESIGKWHALIASYDVTSNGCTEARDDVDAFSRTLQGRGYDEKFVYIVRTKISNNYAVTVDAGSDRVLAGEMSRVIREVARENTRDSTGVDSFVQGNRNWAIDPKCTYAKVIGG